MPVDTVFEHLRRIVYEKSGISLGENKKPLLYARVGKRMRALGLQDLSSYLHYLLQDGSGEESVRLIDAVSTNVTGFFREPVHFSVLAEVIAGWMDQGRKRFRFWSAACSTGEEPYSMAMQLLETFPGAHLDAKILATDISTQVLRKAQQGVYPEERLVPLPQALREIYFERVVERDEVLYIVRPQVKSFVMFRRLNLTEFPLPLRGPVDVVFCRNVMIYFDVPTRMKLLSEMERIIRPGGYLMVGHAESLIGFAGKFKFVRPSVYMRL